VVNQSGSGGVVFYDLPSIPDGPTGKFLLTQMASVAELEGGIISQRNAQERNADVLPRITAMRQGGMSVSAIAERLNQEHIPAPRGGKWYPTSVQRILTQS
jgi:hypothetical protein